MKNFIFIFIIFSFVYSCAHNPYRAANRSYKKQVKNYARQLKQYPLKDSMSNSAYWLGTTNFNMRRPNFVIIHHTEQDNCEQTLKTFTLPLSQVSAHYVICKDGTIHHMLNDYLRAWHAGLSKWGNNTDINSSSIGIELDNNGTEPFTEMQISSLTQLLGNLKRSYNIPTANFIGHADIAPTRKNDPNIYFPWKELAEMGFGMWYDDTSFVKIPQPFDHLQALRLIGYDLKDTVAATLAFKRHWLQDTIPGLTNAEKKVLYQLQKKFQ